MNLVITYTVLVIFIQIIVSIAPVLFMIFYAFNYSKIVENDTEFYQKYDSVFFEFGNRCQLAHLMFYPLFFFRRLAYAFILYNLSHSPILQISLNAAISFILILFLLLYKPFSTVFLNIYNTFQEIIIFVAFVLSSMFIKDLKNSEKNVLCYVIIGVVGTGVLINYFILVALSAQEFCKNFKSKIPPKSSTVTPDILPNIIHEPVESIAEASPHCHPNSAELTFMMPPNDGRSPRYRKLNFLFGNDLRDFKSRDKIICDDI